LHSFPCRGKLTAKAAASVVNSLPTTLSTISIERVRAKVLGERGAMEETRCNIAVAIKAVK
jgi:hypothetical protein